MDKQQAVLDALELELQFIEGGGYDPSVREPRKELIIFRDSPSCLNYAVPLREHPCSECWLIDFVPAEKRGEAFPCHHIPLNDRGDTLAFLRDGNRIDAQETMRDWLLRTISTSQSGFGVTICGTGIPHSGKPTYQELVQNDFVIWQITSSRR